MSAVNRKPFSYWRNGLELGVPLLLWNVYETYRGHERLRLYGDLFAVALFALAFVATRLWPDKIHFRRPGE